MAEIELPEEGEEAEAPKINHVYIIKMLQNRAKFYRSMEGWGFVDIVIGDKRWAAVQVQSRRFTKLIYALVQSVEPDGFPTTRVIEDVRGWALAQVEGTPARDISHRINKFGEKLVYDLADEEGRFIVIEDGNWRVEHGVYPFMRGEATRPQAEPARTDKRLVDVLRPFVNCSERDLHLIAGWLLGCFKVGGPYPVLALNGMQGSAKSTTSRLLKMLIDPHGHTFVDPPRQAQDWLAAMRNRFLLVFDNLSYMRADFADQLCKVATKTAIVTRELYTNGQEVGIEATRPIILNGIPSFTERPDLVDRMVCVTLNPIGRHTRMTDDDYWAAVDAAFPELLGALFAEVGRAQLQSRTFKLPTSHRMANFIHWAASALGEPFIAAYDHAMRDTVDSSIETNTFAMAIIKLMREVPEWMGTLEELQTALAKWKPFDDKLWPTSVQGMRSAVKRYAPVLASVCIRAEQAGRETVSGHGRKLYRFRRTSEWGHLEFSSEVSVSEG
jgi:putative DNA primase/helicase